MLPNSCAFAGRDTFEENGKVFYRCYKINKQGKFQIKLRVVSIDSSYNQAIAFSLSSAPKFKGTIYINGNKFTPEKKSIHYVIPVTLQDKNDIIMDFDIDGGYVYFANASDFLDDYPELIQQISAQTGRGRDQFRGNSFTSGFTASYLYGNAFWIEYLSENCFRFHCNDHKMDDDYNDFVFDIELIDSIFEP